MKKLLLVLLFIPLLFACEKEQEYETIEIGSWDMFSHGNIQISNDLFNNKPDIKIIIRNDYDTKEVELKSWNNDLGDYNGSYHFMGNTLILVRKDDGIFNSPDYRNTEINRGYIEIPK